MTESKITPKMPMNEILSRWPETIPVFLEYKMSCIGCYMSSFDTLEEALAVHNLPIKEMVEALNKTIVGINGTHEG
jgi:hybrid cluster-associated redox disulfide protein